MGEAEKTQVVWHQHAISRDDRQRRLRQRGCVVWLTGLSGCGKSTVANALDRILFDRQATTYLLDGDNIRHGLCAPTERLRADHGDTFAERFGLGFSAVDREENIRRIGSVAELFAAAGIIVITAFVSPYRRDRLAVRRRVEQAGQPGDFIEVFMDTPLEICEQRDPKGLYQQARAGKISNFTGISDPYEIPKNPELRLDGSRNQTPEQFAQQIVEYLQQKAIIPAGN
jgi:adenylylsulfate kinase